MVDGLWWIDEEPPSTIHDKPRSIGSSDVSYPGDPGEVQRSRGWPHLLAGSDPPVGLAIECDAGAHYYEGSAKIGTFPIPAALRKESSPKHPHGAAGLNGTFPLYREHDALSPPRRFVPQLLIPAVVTAHKQSLPAHPERHHRENYDGASVVDRRDRAARRYFYLMRD